MKRAPAPRRLATIAALVFVWCALWGEASVANIASGLLLSVAVTWSGVGTAGRGGVRLRPLARFIGLVAVDLCVATYNVAREVLTPTDRTSEVIIAVPTPADARTHLLLLIVAVTVTPGTAVVDADPDTGTLYLHLLHAEHRVATTEHVQRLAALACEALPVGSTPTRQPMDTGGT